MDTRIVTNETDIESTENSDVGDRAGANPAFNAIHGEEYKPNSGIE